MALQRLRVSNFRGLRELELDFDPTTVLIGENNVGKSSLLLALERCLGAERETIGFQPEDFRRGAEDARPPPIEIELHFREEAPGSWDQPVCAALSPFAQPAPDGRRRLQWCVRAARAAEPPELAFRSSDGAKHPATAAAIEALRSHLPFVLIGTDRYFRRVSNHGAAPESAAPGGALDEHLAELTTRLSTLGRGPTRDEIHAMLGALGETLAAPAEPRTPGALIRSLIEAPLAPSVDAGPRLLARLQGAGTQSLGLLVLVGALLEARGHRALHPGARPILAIEEPEAHLHPRMLAPIWGLIAGIRAQKILTTNSADLLAAVPLDALRRIGRPGGQTRVFRADPGDFDIEETRRIAYHLRIKRGSAFFARCWLLIEGESEFWLLPELARHCGWDLMAEGVELVEFAQCGPLPLAKLANQLGIGWHLIADGDDSGRSFAEAAAQQARGDEREQRITLLHELDIEHCLWQHGYAPIYQRAAGLRRADGMRRSERPAAHARRVLGKAVRASSKPRLALEIARALAEPGSPGVPPPLRSALEQAVRLAREQR